MSAPRPWPIELRLKRSTDVLTASFDDGAAFDLPAEYLRVMTPSAADRGHGAGPGRCVSGKQGVSVTDLTPVGRYAVRIRFSDGHDTGLYSWDELYRLGQGRERLWADYLKRLEREGLSR
ncbi:gamma-butyrobetaine hydroxylase-like domain-containing protein [Phenylobacterium montanum]|uniref:DUF971 domain-containing protein n=1 Tax=Phenylobacterium montanum TaxID=2823693 RepID=A0A975ITE6_9CAUL|nr:DUF971 domain-containing protein [Caulobacter sp. S6]QUD86384.1 DUF971 domain-containing protein [Caulobacter sp. S6]